MNQQKIFYGLNSINFHTSKLYHIRDFDNEEKKVLTSNSYTHSLVYNLSKLKDSSYENAKKTVLLELNKSFSDYDIKIVNKGISITTENGFFNSFNFTYSKNEKLMIVFAKPRCWFSEKYDKEMKDLIKSKLESEDSDAKKRKAFTRAMKDDDIEDEIDDLMNSSLYEDIEDNCLTNYKLDLDVVTKFLSCLEKNKGSSQIYKLFLECSEKIFNKFESRYQDKDALKEAIKQKIIDKITYDYDEDDLC